MVQISEARPGIIAETAADHELVELARKTAHFKVGADADRIAPVRGFQREGDLRIIPVRFFQRDRNLRIVHVEHRLFKRTPAKRHVCPFTRLDPVHTRSPRNLVACGIERIGRIGDMVDFNDKSLFGNIEQCVFLCLLEVSYTDSAFVSKAYDKKGSKFNVRCVSDEKVRYGYMGTYGTLTDSRDGHEYKTVEINGATWMAENLDYASSTASCHRDSCDINGMHYTYPFSADTLEPLCPEGWHISTTADWDSLLAFVRAKDSLNYAYDLKDPFAWPSNEKGNDKYGFGLLPNTCYYDNSGYDLVNVRDESVACIGAESPDGNAGYYYIHSTNNVNSIYRNIYKRNIQKDSRFRYGIRCVKDK